MIDTPFSLLMSWTGLEILVGSSVYGWIKWIIMGILQREYTSFNKQPRYQVNTALRYLSVDRFNTIYLPTLRSSYPTNMALTRSTEPLVWIDCEVRLSTRNTTPVPS